MTTWLNLLSVAAGGAVGSVGRYLIALVSASLPGGSTMLGTTIANVLGCVAIGAFSEYVVLAGHVKESVQLGVQVGILGGLTTFSTFALESTVLAETGRWPLASLYVLTNLIVGWIAVFGMAALVKGWMT